MSNYKRITASPEALGEFLASLPVVRGPWDESFNEQFCDSCEQECDVEHCPHKNERNNPLWWLYQMAGDEQWTHEQTAYFLVWRDGRLMVEQKREKKAADCCCVGIDVYLGRKEQGGIQLRGVKKILLPTVDVSFRGEMEPSFLKVTFQSLEYAENVIKALGKPCTIEIRTAEQHLNEAGKWEVHGNIYILEAAPLEIVPKPLRNGGSAEVTICFLVSRYTANDEKGRERWSFEWGQDK